MYARTFLRVLFNSEHVWHVCGFFLLPQITIWSMSGTCLKIWTNMAICPTVISGLIFTTDDVAQEPS